MLKGYKTYVVGALGVISAVASYLVGDISLAQAAQLAFTAVIGMALRSAIS